MKSQVSAFLATLSALSPLALQSARADVVVSAGYYDVAPCCGNTNPFPSPWYGSPNTTYFGDISNVTGSDPDEAAILIQNTGTSAVTLAPGVTVGTLTLWNSFIGTDYSIGPGQNIILSATIGDNFDGSDIGLGGSVVSLTINGTSYNFKDTNNILSGWPGGSADETLPWSQIGDISFSSGVPEPATWAMMLMGFAGLGFIGYRRAKTNGVATGRAVS
jgi:hypothetical protein